MAFQLNAFQEGFAQIVISVVVEATEDLRPPSTYSSRFKTRQEEYEEYLEKQTKRNNYIMMMAAL